MFLWHWLSGSGTGPAPRTRGTSLIFFRRVNPGCPELRPDLRERYPLALVRHVDVRGEPAADLGAQDGAAETKAPEEATTPAVAEVYDNSYTYAPYDKLKMCALSFERCIGKQCELDKKKN